MTKSLTAPGKVVVTPGDAKAAPGKPLKATKEQVAISMKAVANVRTLPKYFTLGNKQRSIKFDLNSYAAIEERYESVEAAFEELELGKIKTIRFLLWAGLIHEETIVDDVTGEPSGYNINIFEVGQMIGPDNMQDLTERLLASIFEGQIPPEFEEVEAKGVPEAPEAPKAKMATVVLTAEEQKEQDEKNA